MTALTIALACVAVVAAVVAVLALVALRRGRSDAERRAEALQERLDAVESRLRERAATPVVRAQQEYVITHLGDPEAEPDRTPVPVRLTAPAFADAVARETVVQAASLVQGVRRALAPETRNRIRFEMRRELKRSRKERKAEVKEALREYRARHRAELTEGEGAA
jgi:vacuolar-type H+-ATPase subunit E/Vma4